MISPAIIEQNTNVAVEVKSILTRKHRQITSLFCCIAIAVTILSSIAIVFMLFAVLRRDEMSSLIDTRSSADNADTTVDRKMPNSFDKRFDPSFEDEMIDSNKNTIQSTESAITDPIESSTLQKHMYPIVLPGLQKA